MDINFNITILDFMGIVNINSTSNYTKVWNKANKEGANNNGWDGASNNSKDDNNREDVGGVKI